MSELLQRSQMLLLSGSANRPLSEEVAAHLGQPLCQVTVKRFSDGEIFVKIDENVRGRDVFVIQPTNPPAENLIELLLLIDAARRASAARITAVIPYFGYARQDRKDQPRVAISAKLMANMIPVAGADRVLAMDFHSHQMQGFFDLPVDHLYAAPVFVNHYRQKSLRDLVVVASDVGRRQDGARVRQAAECLAGDHRQAPPVGQRGRSGERRGRGQGEGLHHPRRHDRYRRHDVRGDSRAQAARRRGHLLLRHPRDCSPGRRWSA